ncbi:MAG: ADP-ribosylglycohydrolase family protein [Armatimonadetes bacterium]|nr:ADP-ribosylglycohydrolase family protein [Armatimonadota bacterium]
MRFRFPVSLFLFWLAAAAHTGPQAMSEAQYFDQVQGAWLGKCIGGALGMPVEGWRYWDIEKKYPAITGYIGYFQEDFVGWSGIHNVVSIPKDGEWHSLRAAVKVPTYDTGKSYASPIIGLSYEYSTAPASWEMRNLRLLRPRLEAASDNTSWLTSNASYWTGEGAVRFDFTGERSWLKLRAIEARKLALRPGDTFFVAFEARWLSGDNRIGFAFDYKTRKIAKGFGPDDDTSYQIVGLDALETFGPDLSSRQIGQKWVERLPAIDQSLAEGLALSRMREGILPPRSGEHSIGEAIGGQMKGEIWGLVSPGRPDLAAEYARRDGVVAHTKNGVYGEQFIAAMMSQAFLEKDIRKIIETGLKNIPRNSRYAAVIQEVIALYDRKADWKEARRIVVEKYPGICNPVYSEAGIVALSLLYGKGDFEKSILIAASCGNDTDCNTASVGALLGCIRGAKAIPSRWKDPLEDRFRSFAKGLEEWRISKLSRRICAAGRKVMRHHGAGVKFSSDI